MKRNRTGQSMGEYAILFAIVLGAAIAMQQFVKARLQGAIASAGAEYERQTGFINPGQPATFEPARDVTSSSTSGLAMQSAKAGTVTINSDSTTKINK